MDDASDRGYSRAPEVDDLIGHCQALNAQGARYLLIGGFALVLHGFVRTTKDIDILVDPSDENLRAVKRALARLPDNAAADVNDDDVRRYSVVRVADEMVVALMGAACGVPYTDVQPAEIEVRMLDGVAIPVAGKRLLIRTKQTLRESDRIDVRFLTCRLEEER